MTNYRLPPDELDNSPVFHRNEIEIRLNAACGTPRYEVGWYYRDENDISYGPYLTEDSAWDARDDYWSKEFGT